MLVHTITIKKTHVCVMCYTSKMFMFYDSSCAKYI